MQCVNGNEIIISLFEGDGKGERLTTRHTGSTEQIRIVLFSMNLAEITPMFTLCGHPC